MIADPPIRIVRSDRRRRTISARLVENGTVLEVLAPLAATDAELAPIIENLKRRVLRQAERRDTADDSALARAEQVS